MSQNLATARTTHPVAITTPCDSPALPRGL